jgi:hypothetical protein
LVEGERTEPKIYRKWVEYSFPKLTFVSQIQSVTNDCYCIFAGGGYPKIFTDEPSPLDICLRDIKDHGAKKTGHLPSLKRLFDIWDVIKRA